MRARTNLLPRGRCPIQSWSVYHIRPGKVQHSTAKNDFPAHFRAILPVKPRKGGSLPLRQFGLCLFYGLCVFTIAFSLFWMALPRLPLPEAPADETPPISGSVSSLVQAAAPTAAGYYLCDTGGRVAVYACNADGTPGALQQLTGIYVNLLPENDVLRIRRGIRVHSLPELQALLEDLGG